MATIVNAANTETNSNSFNSIYETEYPTVRNIGDGVVIGDATVPKLARGITDNTGIAFSNSNVFHICEPFGVTATKNTSRYILDPNNNVVKFPNVGLGVPVLKMNILLKSATVQKIISDIRSTIENALGSVSPILQAIQAAGAYIANILKTVNYILKVYNTIVATVIIVEQYINTIINFIASLPIVIANAMAECVTLLANALTGALTGSLNINTGGLLSQVQQLSTNISTAVSYTNQAATGATNVANNLSSLGSNLSNNVTLAVSTVQNTLTNAQTSYTPTVLVKVV